MFSWTLCVSVCDTLCLWVCLVVWKKRKKCLRKSKETLNSLEGVFLWKGMLFSTPSQTPSTSISLSFSVSLPNTQSGRRSETDLKEEKKNRRAAWQFASLSVPHTQTWGRSAKNGTDFTYFWNRATHCHVDVLQPTSTADELNMASSSAQSQRRLSGEDYRDQKMTKPSAL